MARKRTQARPSIVPNWTEAANSIEPKVVTTAGTTRTVSRHTGRERIRSIVPRAISPLTASEPRPSAQPTHTSSVTTST